MGTDCVHSIEIELNPGSKRICIYYRLCGEQRWRKMGVKRCHQQEKSLWNDRAVQHCWKVDKAFEELKSYWNALLSNTFLKATMKNSTVWLIYGISTSVWLHSTCQEALHTLNPVSEEYGFQRFKPGLAGFVHQIPERARERLLDLAATQLEDGSAYHQYQPLTKKGNNEIGSNFNDDRCGWFLQLLHILRNRWLFNTEGASSVQQWSVQSRHHVWTFDPFLLPCGKQPWTSRIAAYR